MARNSGSGQMKRKSSPESEKSDYDDGHGSLQNRGRKQARVTIMHVCPPVVVSVRACEFRLAVQKLTGFNQDHGCHNCDSHHHQQQQDEEAFQFQFNNRSTVVSEEDNKNPMIMLHQYSNPSSLSCGGTTTSLSASIISSPTTSSHSYHNSIPRHQSPLSDVSSNYDCSDNLQENTDTSLDQMQPFSSLLDDDVSTLDCYHPSLDHLQYDELATPTSMHAAFQDLDFSIIDSYCPSLEHNQLELIVS